MKKYLFLLIIIVFLQVNYTNAAVYKAALGARLEAGKDGNHGLSYKYFLSESNAFEAMVLSDLNNGIEGHLFYIYQDSLPAIPKEFNWYIGIGGHVGVWEAKKDGNEVVAGPDGLIGLEYKFPKIPLALSIDWHPLYNIVTEKNEKFWPMKFGITARYTF